MWLKIFLSFIVLTSAIAIIFGPESLQANIFYGLTIAVGAAWLYFDDTPYDGDNF